MFIKPDQAQHACYKEAQGLMLHNDKLHCTRCTSFQKNGLIQYPQSLFRHNVIWVHLHSRCVSMKWKWFFFFFYACTQESLQGKSNIHTIFNPQYVRNPENIFNLDTTIGLKIINAWQCANWTFQLSCSASFWSTFVSSKRQMQPLGHKQSPHVTILPSFKRQLPVFSGVQSHLLNIKRWGLKSNYTLHLEQMRMHANGEQNLDEQAFGKDCYKFLNVDTVFFSPTWQCIPKAC